MINLSQCKILFHLKKVFSKKNHKFLFRTTFEDLGRRPGVKVIKIVSKSLKDCLHV